MDKHTMNGLKWEEIERHIWDAGMVFMRNLVTEVLQDVDKQLAESRDKKRFALKDKRVCQQETLFGFVEVKRNYYRDRETNQYVYLLDQAIQFNGGGFSPNLEKMALEMATQGSYRKASHALKQFLGYSVMSHESVRQRVLAAQSVPSPSETSQRVLFVEVDGLYTKFQRSSKRGKEVKIAAVHEGWSRNGKRTSLVNKKHYVHKGKAPFWEGFETFLLDQYGYDPKQTLLIINGDGATWIQNAREHFGASAFVCLDRFHIAKEIKDLFHDHPRYRALRKALARYDVDGLFLELNSAVGTLQTEEREERLEKFIALLTKNKQGLRNYRTWLCLEKNISTEGIQKRTRQVSSIPKQVTELVRQNIPALGQSAAKPLFSALKGLSS